MGTNSGERVWCEESGSWEYQKQSREYGRVCKAENGHRDKTEQSWREQLQALTLGLWVTVSVTRDGNFRWLLPDCRYPVTEISVGSGLVFKVWGSLIYLQSSGAVWKWRCRLVSVIVLVVSVDIQQHWTVVSQSSGTVRKWRCRLVSVIVLVVSVDIQQHWTVVSQSSGTVRKWRCRLVSVIVLVVSVDIQQHWTVVSQSSGTVWKWRCRLVSVIVLVVSVDIQQHWTVVSQSSGTVRKWRWPSWAPRP